MAPRVHERVPYRVQVQYRTPSAFLIAYTLNLSKGGLFLETEHMVPVGSTITLELSIPGVGPMNIQGHVTWQRAQPTDSAPSGIGVEFDGIDQVCGVVIDDLVTRFAGITVLVMATHAKDRSSLARKIRSIIATAQVVEASGANTVLELLDDDIDVAVVDVDADDDIGFRAIGAAQNRATPIPTVALAVAEETRNRARDLGADEVVASPARTDALRVCLLNALSRPIVELA